MAINKQEIVMQGIRHEGKKCFLQNLFISSKTIGFLGCVGQVELNTYSDGKTHIGIKDVFGVLNDDKEFLCKCNNKVIRSVLEVIEELIQKNKIKFVPKVIHNSDQNLVTTDVGILEDDVQKLYDKYSSGIFEIV